MYIYKYEYHIISIIYISFVSTHMIELWRCSRPTVSSCVFLYDVFRLPLMYSRWLPLIVLHSEKTWAAGLLLSLRLIRQMGFRNQFLLSQGCNWPARTHAQIQARTWQVQQCNASSVEALEGSSPPLHIFNFRKPGGHEAVSWRSAAVLSLESGKQENSVKFIKFPADRSVLCCFVTKVSRWTAARSSRWPLDSIWGEAKLSHLTTWHELSKEV